MRRLRYDVVVVGGGGAGLRAAIAAKESKPNLKVLLITKGVLGKSGVTANAYSDRMAFHATLPSTEPEGLSGWRYHAEDIYRIGGFVSDWDLAQILASESYDAFQYLTRLGVPFVSVNGRPHQFVTDGSEYARACYTGTDTAVQIEQALLRRLRGLEIDVLEHHMAGRLVVSQGRISGLLAIDTQERQDIKAALSIIEAGAVVLATGGAGSVYRDNVFPTGMSGDGYALAFDAGAELVNMEFIQIGLASKTTKLNCSGSMMRAMPRIINDLGEEFLPWYLSVPPGSLFISELVFRKGASWPVSFEHDTRIIDIAVYQEIARGRRVFLDYSTNPSGFRFKLLDSPLLARYFREQGRDLGEKAREESPLNRLKELNQPVFRWLREHGVDLELEPKLEVVPAIQHFQGGVKIRRFGDTSITGLFAVGEVAGGQHGANRPGGNALLDGQVFGKIAGQAAADLASGAGIGPIPEKEVQRFLEEEFPRGKGGMSGLELRREIQEVMARSGSVVRTASGMQKGISIIDQMVQEEVDYSGYRFAYQLENANMLKVAGMVLSAALVRNESRGPHLVFAGTGDVEPLVRQDPEWQKYIVIRRVDGRISLSVRDPIRPDSIPER